MAAVLVISVPKGGFLNRTQEIITITVEVPTTKETVSFRSGPSAWDVQTSIALNWVSICIEIGENQSIKKNLWKLS